MTENDHSNAILSIIATHVSQFESNDSPDIARKGKPFLKHVAYFEDNNGDITRRSIGTNWKNLSKESYAFTFLKGSITISGANAVNESNILKSSDKSTKCCPFIESFKTEQIMPLLKHTNDTGIVNKDGSINRKVLEDFCVKYFEYSETLKTYILPESSMKKYLAECLERDKLLVQSFRWYLPSTSVVANAEWNDFYLNFSNCTKDKERAVTLDVFCDFYYAGDKLYANVLNKPDDRKDTNDTNTRTNKKPRLN
jgi:hypothetical protein